MKLLQHTDDHQATYMRDIYEPLLGSIVNVFTKGSHIIRGTLQDYNTILIHITNQTGLHNTYIKCDEVVAISSDK